MFGSVTGSALSTGCFLPEHLREQERVNTDENKDAKHKDRTTIIFNATPIFWRD